MCWEWARGCYPPRIAPSARSFGSGGPGGLEWPMPVRYTSEGFVGRERELSRLAVALDGACRRPLHDPPGRRDGRRRRLAPARRDRTASGDPAGAVHRRPRRPDRRPTCGSVRADHGRADAGPRRRPGPGTGLDLRTRHGRTRPHVPRSSSRASRHSVSPPRRRRGSPRSVASHASSSASLGSSGHSVSGDRCCSSSRISTAPMPRRAPWSRSSPASPGRGVWRSSARSSRTR